MVKKGWGKHTSPPLRKMGEKQKVGKRREGKKKRRSGVEKFGVYFQKEMRSSHNENGNRTMLYTPFGAWEKNRTAGMMVPLPPQEKGEKKGKGKGRKGGTSQERRPSNLSENTHENDRHGPPEGRGGEKERKGYDYDGIKS